MKRRLALALAATPLLAASDEPLKGYVPVGEAAHCVNDTNLSPTILDAHRVGLRQGARRWWVSEIADCPALEPFATLVVERYGGPICDTDRFRVLNPPTSIPSNYCRFGAFVPYERAAKRR